MYSPLIFNLGWHYSFLVEFFLLECHKLSLFWLVVMCLVGVFCKDSLWESMRILVMGDAGDIGSHTCLELLVTGHEVVVIDNFSNSNPTVFDRIERICGCRSVIYREDVRKTISYEVVGPRVGDVAVCYADISQARDEMVCETQFGIEDMCRDVWNWQSTNLDGYEEQSLINWMR